MFPSPLNCTYFLSHCRFHLECQIEILFISIWWTFLPSTCVSLFLKPTCSSLLAFHHIQDCETNYGIRTTLNVCVHRYYVCFMS